MDRCKIFKRHRIRRESDLTVKEQLGYIGVLSEIGKRRGETS